MKFTNVRDGIYRLGAHWHSIQKRYQHVGSFRSQRAASGSTTSKRARDIQACSGSRRLRGKFSHCSVCSGLCNFRANRDFDSWEKLTLSDTQYQNALVIYRPRRTRRIARVARQFRQHAEKLSSDCMTRRCTGSWEKLTPFGNAREYIVDGIDCIAWELTGLAFDVAHSPKKLSSDYIAHADTQL